MKFTAKQIAEYLQGCIEGDETVQVHTFAKIEEGCEGGISFLANARYVDYLYTTASSVVLVNADFEPTQAVKPTLIRVPNAYEALTRLLTLYEASRTKKEGIHPLASVAKSARLGTHIYIGAFAVVGDEVEIGDGVQIFPHAVIEDGVRIGEGSILYPHVSVYYNCVIGRRCILHSGAVIGADGFGFAPTESGYDKIPQIGIVTLEDDVEIGANTCVDRSTMGSTRVRRGVKLDNLVQIAHNVEVGEHTVMSAQSGVAGSAKIGQWCMFGGQAGISGHITVGDKTMVGAQAGVHGTNEIKRGGATVIGTPAIDVKNFARSNAVYKKLPDVYAELNTLRREIEELKKHLKQE